MVHQIVLCQLKPEVSPERMEEMMRQTRARLLRIPEFRTVSCGKRIHPEEVWTFFFAVDFETLDKMRAGQKTPTYVKFEREVLAPHVDERLTLTYELEPGKNVKYS